MIEWVRHEMRDFGRPWCVAGGWALDLFIGEQSRPHSDIDIALFREDQAALRVALDGWSFAKVENRRLYRGGLQNTFAFRYMNFMRSGRKDALSSC